MNAYAGTATLLKVKFPSAKAGLATVGYTLKNANDTTYAARSTVGVVNRSNGSFSVLYTPPAVWNGTVIWDTGEGTPLYADEEINVLAASSTGGTGSVATTIIVKVNNIPLDNVAIYVTTDIYGNNIVAGTSFTDSFGKVSFMLDAGVYYVWKQRAGTNFTNPESITVA